MWIYKYLQIPSYSYINTYIDSKMFMYLEIRVSKQ